MAQPHASRGFAVLYSFGGGRDGGVPVANLIALNGTLYGTTEFGGTGSCYSYGLSGCGTVFAITISGKEHVLHRFRAGSDGEYPLAGLIAVNGKLYGTTGYGGGSGCGGSGTGCGTVYEVDTSGKERVLYRFKGAPDGGEPFSQLVSSNGRLYGTTSGGGASNAGTIFEVSTSGKERVLYSFSGGSYAGPLAGLTSYGGTLYGTTAREGKLGAGTVFALSSSGKERLVHNFGKSDDGAEPYAALAVFNGRLYGSTVEGGLACSGIGSGDTCGTVFEVGPSRSERVVHRFNGGDGAWPYAGLIEVDGRLYGTTKLGGNHGGGSVFEVSASGKEKILYSFDGTDGELPVAGLLYLNGGLYGTASFGGANNAGTVFRVAP
ncbi:MAG TPA: choice-of-anchor tandem repeat GloVer-containing protein [Candidatus Cybelea sp.]|nr:choice-of-anchor tandem repeat GloVer-containing protein [Candidatus Cybelea sp.]